MIKIAAIALMFIIIAESTPASNCQILEILTPEGEGYNGRISCAISIQKSVNSDDLKKIICKVIYKEHLDKYRAINLVVYYQLTTLKGVPDKLRSERLICFYLWNSVIKDNPGHLYIVRDGKGIRIDPGINLIFNYKKDCS
jgi:hypothetical protein